MSSGRSASDLVDAPDPSDAARPQREGLPPGFRMRADPHYVEQLTARVPLPQLRAIPVREIAAEAAHDLRDLEPLVRSISRFGVLQPLLVRSRGGRFELIAGARRLAAASEAGLTDVPCLIYTCDDARARALGEADNIRGVRPAPPAPEPATPAAAPASADPLGGLGHLRQSFGTIDSCLHLLGSRDAVLRDRVALDLVRTEVGRAERLVRSLSALQGDVALTIGTVSMRALVEQTLDGLQPERRLGGIAVDAQLADEGLSVPGDPEWLGVAAAGAIGGMLAMVEAARTPALHVELVAAGRTAALHIVQHCVSLPPAALGRLLDPSWTDRPGGYQAAIELAAARRIIERHGGTVELAALDRGGCRLTLTLPLA